MIRSRKWSGILIIIFACLWIIMGNGVKAAEPSPSVTAAGSECYISYGSKINYFGWFTRKFNVRTENGEYLGYCAQPSLYPSEGMYTISELNDDRIKAVMLTNPYGPEPDPVWKNAIMVENDDIRYGIAHALIGFYYTGGTEGFEEGGEGTPYHTIFRAMPAAMQHWINTHPDILERYVAYIAHSENAQDIVWVEEKPKGYVGLKKQSANMEITNGNECYRLEGAEYGVYKDEQCESLEGILVTDSTGMTNVITVEPGFYYLREISAPEGYEKDKNVYEINVKKEETVIVDVVEYPETQRQELLLQKYDVELGEQTENFPQGEGSLEGARFEVQFYGAYYDEREVKEAIPVRTWIFATDKEGRIYFTKEYFIEGDELWQEEGEVVLPYGTILIREIEAPLGYLINDDLQIKHITPYKESEKTVVKQVVHFPEKIIRGNVEIIKYGLENIKEGIKKPLEGIIFRFVSRTNGKEYVITTDENGYASTESLGGLPYDTYIVTEENVPDNYIPADVFEISIREEEEMISCIIENEKISIPDETEEQNIPKTGDEKDAAIYMVMLLLGVVAAVISSKIKEAHR